MPGRRKVPFVILGIVLRMVPCALSVAPAYAARCTLDVSDNGTIVRANDSKIKVWRPNSVLPALTLTGGQVAISRDANLIATGEKTITAIRSAADGSQLATLPHVSPVQCVAFVGNDEVVTLSRDGTTVGWKRDSGRWAKAWQQKIGAADLYPALAVSQSGRLVAATDKSGGSIFDARTGKLVQAITYGDAVGFSPDDSEIFILHLDGMWLSGRFMDVHSGKRLRLYRPPSVPNGGYGSDAALAPNGKFVATGHWGDAVSIWDPRAPITNPPAAPTQPVALKTLPGLGISMAANFVLFTPDSSSVIVDDFHSVKTWNFESGEVRMLSSD